MNSRPSSFVWRQKTTVFVIVGLVLVLLWLVGSYVWFHFKPTTEVRLGAGVYHLWLADTEAERIQGLSGVKQLKPNGGLLMDFQTDDTWGIWMKDMKVPLDIIWLDVDKNVVFMVENVQPEESTDVVHMPKDKARYVIELPEGAARKAGIKKGMTASFSVEGGQ